MKRIPLTQGKFALVSNRDYEWLSKWNWHVQKDGKTFYVLRMAPRDAVGKQKHILMHQVIFGGPCDHKNRNGLDNRRCNLRQATKSQQQCNRGLYKNNTSGYKGVRFERNKWRARIKIYEVKIHLGYFNSKEMAARAYDKAALKYHGEFAVLNFPKLN